MKYCRFNIWWPLELVSSTSSEYFLPVGYIQLHVDRTDSTVSNTFDIYIACSFVGIRVNIHRDICDICDIWHLFCVHSIHLYTMHTKQVPYLCMIGYSSSSSTISDLLSTFLQTASRFMHEMQLASRTCAAQIIILCAYIN